MLNPGQGHEGCCHSKRENLTKLPDNRRQEALIECDRCKPTGICLDQALKRAPVGQKGRVCVFILATVCNQACFFRRGNFDARVIS